MLQCSIKKLKCKLEPELEPDQSDSSGSSQIPRLRVAPKPCFPELFVDTDLSFKSLNKFVVILLFVEILQNIQTFHV